MADDAERAAKAARAKAMLKKRQQQKAGISPSPSPAPGAQRAPAARSPSPPSARSPEHKDASTLFGDSEKGAIDFGEFGVLSHARSPVSPAAVTSPSPQPVTSPPPLPHNGDPGSDQLRTLVSNQQQTISLLVNEKASLSTQLDRLEDLETKSAESDKLLDQERKRADNLASRLRHLEEQARSSAERLDEVEQREREANEKCREQDRELELARRNVGELRTQLENRDHELKELKEHVKADDRVETLGRSLKGTQDRAEELEFQLSKLKQSHASSMRERDTLTQELARLVASETEWKQRHAVLEQETMSTQHELNTLSSSLEAAERVRADLESQLAASETSLTSAQQQLTGATSELASHARQLNGAHTDVVSAQRRADDAEQAQRSLQAENSGLLTQLEEVRPKVVELSNKAAEDEERIWEAEKKVRALEATVAKLEARLEEQTIAAENSNARAEKVEGEKRREEEKHREDLREVQDAFTVMAKELEQVKEYVQKLEKENAEYRSAIQAREQEQGHWKTQAEELAAEVEAVRSELNARRKTEDDALSIVERVQGEVEALRDQLALREDEVARLREGEVPSSSSSRPQSPHHGRQQSLGEEMLSAARQQHALDLSTAHSRIRALETDVFDAQAQAHTFQRRVTALEDELAQFRAQPVPSNAPGRSPPPFPRGSSFHGGSEDSRRHSLSSTRPHTPSSLRPLITARPVYDENLSVETRHKRKVSLSMLKARIESERAAAQHASLVPAVGSPRSSLTRGLSSVAIAEADESAETSKGAQTPRIVSEDRPQSVLSGLHPHPRLGSEVGRGVKRPPQFLDESHVFWCHSCRGDLVVL